MKHVYSLLLSLILLPLGALAQGWPANYGGVMLQAFCWDSYSDTQWTNLTAQADTLSKYFKLIWVPQSGWCKASTNNMGYYPIYWFNQKSAFGSEADLRTMIKTYKAKGTGIIADVVINHKNGMSKWCDFADETVTGQNTGKKYSVSWDHTNYTQICSDDEAQTGTDSEAKGKIKGAKDTGLNDGGCRDLDHTNATTQQNVKTYEDFLINEMGYTGFRYDFVKGYDPAYVKMYNEAAKPQFSVGEYWQGSVTDSKSGDHPFGGVKDWVDATGKTSAAFDFPMKYLIKSAFSGEWGKLAAYTTATLTGVEPQYAVTFVDNHDTGEPLAEPLAKLQDPHQEVHSRPPARRSDQYQQSNHIGSQHQRLRAVCGGQQGQRAPSLRQTQLQHQGLPACLRGRELQILCFRRTGPYRHQEHSGREKQSRDSLLLQSQ